MSPRRKTEGSPSFSELAPRRPGRWVPAAVLGVAVALIVAAVVISALVLVSHEKQRRTEIRAIEAIGYVRSFMTDFTTMDPFNANAYVDRVTGYGTGKFAEDYHARANEVAIAVARSEPTRGEVVDAGVERWNDDGSASVVVLTKTVTTMPDGKRIEEGGRWVARTIQEGDQWKISDLVQVV